MIPELVKPALFGRSPIQPELAGIVLTAAVGFCPELVEARCCGCPPVAAYGTVEYVFGSG